MYKLKTLIIVESPTKANTIKNFLPKDYEVIASVGHIRDLSVKGKGGYGLDIENNFKPIYQVIPGKRKTIKTLEEKAKNKNILIATDPDREGEAIAWHIAEVLKLDPNKNIRIRFYEVTKSAITKALENPTPIDMSLVSSQETRRILDRIIGFDLSKLVQRKLKSTSAGRVQSVALKMITDRELEIKKFVKEAYYLLIAHFDGFKADYIENVKKIKDKVYIEQISKKVSNPFIVTNIEEKNQFRYPPYPYTTSTLQQDGINRLRMSASGVMRVAQKLYEGVAIKGETIGLITYMRTDSTKLSPDFTKSTLNYIKQTYGSDFVGKPRVKKSAKNIQEAHEAIRPTNISFSPSYVKEYLSSSEYRLYQLIYNRTVSSLMKAGTDLVKKVTLNANDVIFQQTFTKPVFLGYRILSSFNYEEKAFEFNYQLNDKIDSKKVEIEEKFTEPKKRYTEASLIDELEKLGIGRPSTYAETTRKIISVGYVKKEKNAYIPTEQGMLTSSSLNDYFSSFINTTYTSKMEEELDLVAQEKREKNEVLTNFYQAFKPMLEKANTNMPYAKIKKEIKLVGKLCPVCGKQLVYRQNRKGETFIACSGYLDKKSCKYTQTVDS